MNLSGVATEMIINSLHGMENFGIFLFNLFDGWKKYVFRDFNRYVNFRDWKVSLGGIFNALQVLTFEYFVNSINSKAIEMNECRAHSMDSVQTNVIQATLRNKWARDQVQSFSFPCKLCFVFQFQSTFVIFHVFFLLLLFLFFFFFFRFHPLIQLKNKVQPLLI